MRPEKEFLVQEIERHLDKGDYVFLTNYDRMSVPDIAALRKALAPQAAEFHVVKNTILSVALDRRGLPSFSDELHGPTAIITGGENPSEVAKVLTKYFKNKDKADVKFGLLGEQRLDRDEVVELSKLPSLEALRAQLLGLLNQPGTSLVRVIVAVPQGLLNVLQAKVDLESEAVAG